MPAPTQPLASAQAGPCWTPSSVARVVSIHGARCGQGASRRRRRGGRAPKDERQCIAQADDGPVAGNGGEGHVGIGNCERLPRELESITVSRGRGGGALAQHPCDTYLSGLTEMTRLGCPNFNSQVG